MGTEGFQVDLNKALVFQVGHLGETHQEWVHQPIICKEPPRFFDNEVIEFLTRTVWWAIPVIWIPVASYLISMSVQKGLKPVQLASMILLGIFIWTFLEYVMHRFLFHMNTTSYWGNTLHYFLHGYHHKHPMDELRLVFPPALTAIICLLFWNIMKHFASPSVHPALFGGGLLGYVAYDVTHYYLHHGKPSKRYTQGLKRYHLSHHFRVSSKGFGVTSALWDIAFDTLPSRKAAERMNKLQ